MSSGSIFARGTVRGGSVGPREIGSQHLSVSALFGGSFSPLVTTDTSDWHDLGTFDFEVISRKAHLYVPITTQLKHSAADAVFGCRCSVYDVDRDTGALTSGIVFYQIGASSAAEGLPLHQTAGAWRDFMPVVDGSLDEDHIGHGEGLHRFVLQFRNWTAGTLTVGHNGNGNQAFGFLMGKA